jgi:hypothetical protein
MSSASMLMGSTSSPFSGKVKVVTCAPYSRSPVLHTNSVVSARAMAGQAIRATRKMVKARITALDLSYHCLSRAIDLCRRRCSGAVFPAGPTVLEDADIREY